MKVATHVGDLGWDKQHCPLPPETSKIWSWGHVCLGKVTVPSRKWATSGWPVELDLEANSVKELWTSLCETVAPTGLKGGLWVVIGQAGLYHRTHLDRNPFDIPCSWG